MLAVSMFTIAMGFMGAYYSGMKANNLDLSPNFAGAIMALTNGIGEEFEFFLQIFFLPIIEFIFKVPLLES